MIMIIIMYSTYRYNSNDHTCQAHSRTDFLNHRFLDDSWKDLFWTQNPQPFRSLWVLLPFLLLLPPAAWRQFRDMPGTRAYLWLSTPSASHSAASQSGKHIEHALKCIEMDQRAELWCILPLMEEGKLGFSKNLVQILSCPNLPDTPVLAGSWQGVGSRAVLALQPTHRDALPLPTTSSTRTKTTSSPHSHAKKMRKPQCTW